MSVFSFLKPKGLPSGQGDETARLVSTPPIDAHESVPPRAPHLETEYVLGGRQESINGLFDEISQAMTMIQDLHGDLRGKQKLLVSEFADRARERGEFVALTKAYNAARDLVRDQSDEIVDIRQRLLATTGQLQERQLALTNAMQECDSARAECMRLALEISQHKAELANASSHADRVIESLNRVEMERSALATQVSELSEKYGDLESRLQSRSQALLSAEAERDGLRKLCDEATARDISSALRIAELEEIVADNRHALSSTEERLRTVQANLARVTVAHDEAVAAERTRAAQDARRLETNLSKLRRLEQDNAAMAQQILAQSEAARAQARAHADATLVEQQLTERAIAAESDNELLRDDLRASEAARIAAVDRGEQLSAVLEKRRLENEQLESRCRMLQSSIEKRDCDYSLMEATLSERERQLADLIERTKGENAILAGALEEARRDRNRMIVDLQRHLQVRKDKASLPPAIEDVLRQIGDARDDNVDFIIR